MLPELNGLIAAFIAAGFGGGLVLLGVYIHGVTPNPARGPGWGYRIKKVLGSRALTSRIAGGVVVAVLTLVMTRWPVAAAGLGALVVFWPQLFGGARAEQQQIVQLEALVMWTESLRDTITARASLEQAIPTTAYSAPLAIRPALIRMAGLLRSRIPLDRALLALSAELDDASADKVIGSLILNVRQRGTGLAAVLTSLATASRAELDQRRQVTAGRSSMRRAVQIVVAVTIGFAVFLVVFSRAYVQPYRSVGGQITLLIVIGLFAASFYWMRKLAGADAPAPFLVRPDVRIADEDLRVIGHLTGLSEAEAEALTANRPVPSGSRS
ncbi:type II secretion system (T2SS) protein F [Jatrophihabitans sp. GAS493]|uniref:type II secretion system F family protein n=1 Tax=Jatrophihabitans sp. GAS493 TaxID=1907575 RepID=UPI000BB9A8DA|nr:type II secretion system F family protein [Jatrophihabitans sp. GAS493]SOD72947.1 type II secretion system (T2SS) protein F [Jatrophihabitans sp. GAS493]